jgi:hypothetical protein
MGMRMHPQMPLAAQHVEEVDWDAETRNGRAFILVDSRSTLTASA